MAGSFKVDIAALQQLLPLSSGSEGENARERMFKELVVRSNCLIQLGQTAAAKGRSRAWNGTLSLESLSGAMADEDAAKGKGLPEGIEKEIIQSGADADFKSPKVGDEVTVHYVGTLTDGSIFDSSRAREQPFTFTLGKGEVIQGWDVGVASMCKGEVSKFTFAPKYAYGEEGSPPKIPQEATLIFEIELINFTSKDDLFSDGGVIKVLVKEGSGWKEPKGHSELQMSLKCCKLEDGSIIEEKNSFEYQMGSKSLGPLKTAVEKGLTTMKKGEECKLTCRKDYAYGELHGDVILHLALEQLYETIDISLAKDKSMLKKQIKEGEGYEKPKECSKVFVKVEGATDGSKPLPGFVPKTLEFVAGDGFVCDALECAVLEMRRAERAALVLSGGCEEPQLGVAIDTKVVFTLELCGFEKSKESWDMSEEEKVDFALERKEVATRLFKNGRYRLAMERYKKILELFNYMESFKDEQMKIKAKELKKTCKLNCAACQLRLQLWHEAEASCNVVLKDEPQNLKALFRRAQAHLGSKNFEDSMRDVKKALDLEPQNREAKALVKEVQAAQKEEDKKSKGFFGKMCQALGTGQIPEPYVDRENHFLELVNHAFTISRESLEPVSAGEQECVDLNQWHVLVFALVMQAALASAAQWKCQKGWVLAWSQELVDPEAFAGLCQHISTTRLTDFPTPQDVSETLSDWAADVSDAMRFFGEMDGTIHFDSFSKWFVTRQLPSWHAGKGGRPSTCRAFQLLKLMNNTPSLPNSVPGKLTPRGPGVALMLKTLPPSQWQSTSRRFFSDSAPRRTPRRASDRGVALGRAGDGLPAWPVHAVTMPGWHPRDLRSVTF
eukprot:g30365.t2